MSIQQMRAAIGFAYQGRSWKRKVSKMSEEQVLAIYRSFVARRIDMTDPNKKEVKGFCPRFEECLSCQNAGNMMICSACHQQEYAQPIEEIQMCFIAPTREEEMEENPSYVRGVTNAYIQGQNAESIEHIIFGSPQFDGENIFSVGTIIALASAAMNFNNQVKEDTKEEEDKMKVNVEFKNRFDNTSTWVTKLASTSIKSMTTDHLMNTLRMFCIHPERTMAMCAEDADRFVMESHDLRCCGMNSKMICDFQKRITAELMNYYTSMDKQDLIDYALTSPVASKMRRELYNRGVNVSNIMSMFLAESGIDIIYEDISGGAHKRYESGLKLVIDIPQNNTITMKCTSATHR